MENVEKNWWRCYPILKPFYGKNTLFFIVCGLHLDMFQRNIILCHTVPRSLQLGKRLRQNSELQVDHGITIT